MKVDVLGIKINSETKAEVITQIESRLLENKKTFIVTPYSESIVAAQNDKEFLDVLNSADIALPDGIGILWSAHFLKSDLSLPSPGLEREKGRGRTVWKLIASLIAIIFNPSFIRDPIPEKISGREFVWDLARLASKNNYSIFLLGGFGDTPERAGERLKKKYPNLKIAGTAAPASDSEISNLQSAIPPTDFLFVALGPIRQEKWIAKNLPNLPIKLAIGLGGTFDYLAAKRPLAPRFWAHTGLEWLWRLMTQPWRAIRISKGVLGLIWYCLKTK